MTNGQLVFRAIGWVALMIGLLANSAAAATKVTLGIPVPMAPYVAYWTYGKQLGFFVDEGIDIDFVSVGGAAVLIPQVANKSITFGMPTPDVPIIALEKGAPYPVKFFYNLYTRQLFDFVVPVNSPIKEVADLRGKKLGVGALTWGSLSVARSVLSEQGIAWMKDVQVLPIGVGAAAWSRLANGDVDAMYMFAHQTEAMHLSGTQIRRLKSPDKYDEIHGNGFLTHEDTIKSNPRLIEGFGRAMAKSHLACQLAPESCVRSYWAYDPASRPPTEKETEWIKTYTHLAQVDAKFVLANQRKGRIGEYNPNSWASLAAIMKIGEQISKTDLNFDQIYTNQFVPAINRFDPDDVKSRIKAK